MGRMAFFCRLVNHRSGPRRSNVFWRTGSEDGRWTAFPGSEFTESTSTRPCMRDALFRCTKTS